MKQINEIRKRLGLTWGQMAEKTGYAEQTLKNSQNKGQPISQRLINAVRQLEKDEG